LTTGDAVNIGLLIVAIVGIGLTYWQVRTGVHTQRAQFLKDLYSTLVSDPDIGEAFYLIEYGRFKYGPDFHGSPLEPKIDRLLAFVDLVAEMHLQKVISDREMEFFQYRFCRLFGDSGVKAYLEFLSQFYGSTGVKKEPYHSFQRVGRKFIERTDILQR